MPNTYANLAVAGGTSTGAPATVSAMGARKTISCAGSFNGTIAVEASNDGISFVPIVMFDSPKKAVVNVVCTSMRTRSTGVGGSPDVDVSAEDAGVEAVTPAVPAGDGSEAGSDVSALGAKKTIIVTGSFRCVVNVEGSLDGTKWFSIWSTDKPGWKFFDATLFEVRVRLSGYVTGTPVVTISGTSDVSVSSGSVAAADADGLSPELVLVKEFAAGAGGAPDDVAIYTADAPFEFRVLETVLLVSTALGGSTVTLRDAAAGAGNALSDDFDTAATGVKRESTRTAIAASIALDGSLVLRRSDSAVAGTAIIRIQKV